MLIITVTPRREIIIQTETGVKGIRLNFLN